MGWGGNVTIRALIDRPSQLCPDYGSIGDFDEDLARFCGLRDGDVFELELLWTTWWVEADCFHCFGDRHDGYGMVLCLASCSRSEERGHVMKEMDLVLLFASWRVNHGFIYYIVSCNDLRFVRLHYTILTKT